MTEEVTDDDVRAAALQYVRKIAGMRAPSTANVEAFDAAVEAVAASTQELLDALVLRPVRRYVPLTEPAHDHCGDPRGQADSKRAVSPQ